MNNNTNSFIILLALFLSFGATTAESGVVIKVRAINPLEEEAPVTIHYPLPAGLTSDDILAKRIARGKGRAVRANFEVNFDENEKVYFVDHQITLGPKEIVVLEIEAKDVWTVPQETVDRLKKEVEDLLKTPPPPPEGEEETGPDPVALKLKDEISRQLDEIVEDQKATAITQVGVQAHIEAYQKSRETLQQVGMDITMLRNMIAAQQAEETPQGETGVQDQAVSSGAPNAEASAAEPAAEKQSVADKLKSLFNWK